jgi:VanZ family protein
MRKIPWKPLLVFWIALILLATLIPGRQLNRLPSTTLPPFADLLVHFVLFSGFAFLYSFVLFVEKYTLSIKYIVLRVVGFGTLFAAFTELLQALLPIQRDGSFADFSADLTGVIAGTLVALLVTAWQPKK